MTADREKPGRVSLGAARQGEVVSDEMSMTGAESVVRSLLASGADTCFANPGTSEMQFVAAFDRCEGMRPVLCLFEGVATGAADGYARMTGRPAATLLHLGPGLANGLANLHNARRAMSPIVNIVGDHTLWHRQFDAPLTSDIEGIARPVSAFVRTVQDVGQAGSDAAQAVAAARSSQGVATLITPADVGWSKGGVVAAPIRPVPPRPVDAARIGAAANALRAARHPAILLSGRVLRRAQLERAGRVAAAVGAQLYCDFFAPRLERGAGLVPVRRLPYFGERVVEELTGADLLILIETDPPVAFFAYPGKPSELTPPDTRLLQLARASEDGPHALSALADLIGTDTVISRQALARPELPKGALTASSAGAVIAALLPENAIVVDESCTSGMAVQPLCQGAAPHDWLSHTGGALGLGLPMAVGAALACPERKTFCLTGDGGAMYTLQSLWTQAREKLDVITIVFSNRAYAILNYELQRLGLNPGPAALSMLDLTRPELRFVDLARGMGVEASRVETAESFASELGSALTARGPRLIELALEQSAA
jgi:acetolactate synthase I/II/III large subunit